MSEKYRVDTDTVSWLVVPYQDDEKVIASFGLRQNAEELVIILNDQAEEIATLKAALDASNAALAEARSFVFDLAAFHSQDTSESKGFERNDLLGWVNAAKNLSGFWVRAAVAVTTQDAPKFKVGDKVRLNFFEHYKKGEHEVVAKVCSGFYRLEIDGEYNDTTEYYDFELTPYNESE